MVFQDLLFVFLVSLLRLLRLHLRLHLLLVFEHLLIVLIVFPSLLEFFMLLAVDIVQSKLSQNISSLFDFSEEREDVVLQLYFVETSKLKVHFG